MKKVFETAMLMATTTRGLTKYWQGCIKVDDDDNHFLQFLTFQEHPETPGEYQSTLRSTPKRVVGKRIGHANETSALDQAKLELASKEEAMRVKKGYHEEGEAECLIGPRPMLAQVYLKHASKLKFPCYGQPKYDGFRMLQDCDNIWSRGNLAFSQDTCGHLRFIGPECNLISDGEVMLPLGNADFNKSQSRISKFYGPDDPPASSELIYIIYDQVAPGTFEQRWGALVDFFTAYQENIPENIMLSETWQINSTKELKYRYEWCLDNGFEGLMLRNSDGEYKSGFKSYDLLKLKPEEEDEFEIVSVLDGRGIDEQAVIFQCATKDGLLFKCRPKMTIPERQRLWTKWTDKTWNPVGQLLTVNYGNLSADGVPRFPRGKNIRDFKLQGGDE